MAKIPIGTAITESLGFVQPGWRRAGAAMGLVGASESLFQGLRLNGMLSGFGPALLILIVQTLIGTLAIGAFYRMALTPDHGSDYQFRPGPGGLQWGSLEWRVLGANILVGMILGLVALAFFFVWAIGLGVLVAMHAIDIQTLQSAEATGGQDATIAAFWRLLLGPTGILSLAILGPGLAVILYLSARLSLYAVRAADTGSFNMGQAWSLTRGATGAIMVTLAIFFVAAMLLGGVAGMIGGILGGVAHMVGGFGSGRMVASIAGTAIGAALSTPIVAGLVTYVYRTERGGGSAIADQFN